MCLVPREKQLAGGWWYNSVNFQIISANWVPNVGDVGICQLLGMKYLDSDFLIDFSSILRTSNLIDIYRQVSNIRRTLVGNKIVDNSDVVGASPVGAAPTTSSLST